MDVIEITEEEYLQLHCRIHKYQKTILRVLDILESEQITARGSMYQKGRHDVARKICAAIEKEI